MGRPSEKARAVREELAKLLIQGPEKRVNLGKMRVLRTMSYMDIIPLIQKRLEEKGLKVSRRAIASIIYREYGGVQIFASLLSRMPVRGSVREEMRKAWIEEGFRPEQVESQEERMMELVRKGAKDEFVREMVKRGLTKEQAERVWSAVHK